MGGVAVLPGDIVVGDVNGVVVIPRLDAEAILAKARDLLKNEAKRVKDLKTESSFPPGCNPRSSKRVANFSDDLSGEG